MANITLKPIQVPGEVLLPQDGSKYEEYREDGVYEYDLFPNGKPNRSHVKIAYTAGDVYEGSLKHGKLSGIGKYFWKDGGTYEGNFNKGILSGVGKYTAANGDVYEGNFKNDKYDGEGKYSWEDGSSFKGTFKNGQLLKGKYTDVNGSIYECKFSYKQNGERKNSVIKLLHIAQPTTTVVHEEEKETKKKAEQKDGLLSKDRTLISIIKKSKRGPEFKNLYSGAAGKTEKAEKSLIAILNFFSNSDADQMARIFKSSGIYDKTKGDEHVTDMITGVIKRSDEFSKNLKSATNSRQNENMSDRKGASR